MKLIVLSSFLLLLAPCNASKKATAETQNAVSDPKTAVITYRRGACFGTCPAYTLTINGSTKIATYKGDLHVAKIGEYEKKISDEQLKSFIEAFEKHHFFQLEDAYTTSAPDHPSKFTTYTIDGKSKKIEDIKGAPDDLKELEKMLEDFSESDGWEKVSKE
jgi:hypothetical protein